MPNPRLIHPIPVELELLNSAETIYDPDTKEPDVAAKRTTKQLQAQVRWFNKDRLRGRSTGPRQEADGYLLFRRTDLVAEGIEINTGDKIVRIGHIQNASYFVTELRPMGHYPDQGGAGLLRADFNDREPVQ